MPSAEIIAIGTELLLGEIQDTNTRDVALFLKNNGIDLYRTTIVGDNLNRIAAAIKESLTRADIILTTGGLGPTVDDPTRDAAAKAIGVKTEFLPELWDQIQDRFKRFGRIATENNRKQAFIPQGALPVENKVGTAPAFIIELGDKVIISLPGVPRELHFLLEEKIHPYLRKKFSITSTIKVKVLHTAGIGESQVDELVADLEDGANPTVGLLAHPGLVDIRITAKAEEENEVDRLIMAASADIKNRLGKAVFGEDDETLEMVVMKKLAQRGWDLTILCNGLSERLLSRLSTFNFSPESIQKLDTPREDQKTFLDSRVKQFPNSPTSVILAILLQTEEDRQKIFMQIKTPLSASSDDRSYGGAPLLREEWAVNQVLDYLRKSL